MVIPGPPKGRSLSSGRAQREPGGDPHMTDWDALCRTWGVGLSSAKPERLCSYFYRKNTGSQDCRSLPRERPRVLARGAKRAVEISRFRSQKQRNSSGQSGSATISGISGAYGANEPRICVHETFWVKKPAPSGSIGKEHGDEPPHGSRAKSERTDKRGAAGVGENRTFSCARLQSVVVALAPKGDTAIR